MTGGIFASCEVRIGLVPEVGLEPTWTQGPGDFEFDGRGGQEDTGGYNYLLLTHFEAARILRSSLL